MSAISGCVGLPIEQNVQQRMLSAMEARGGGIRTVVQEADCTLLQIAQEPPSRSQGAVLVLDGTVYNLEELRQALRKRGRPCGVTMRETVLQSYLAWGENCLEKLEGCFALAIREENRLLLARDPLGLKPLFYSQTGEGLLFGSQQSMILAHPARKAELDQEGAAELLLMGPGRTPGCGVFRGIRELLPGQLAVYEGGRLRLSRYWQLRDRVHTQSLEETAEQVRAMVTASIRQQMGAGAGACLSGGLDSSIICAVGARQLGETGQRLSTFSVDYTNQQQYFRPNAFQPSEDRHYIGLMQQALNSCHTTVTLTPELLAAGLEEAMLARGLPGRGDVDVSLLLLCREIRKTVPVVLSGEGADEIFGGYPWYQDSRAGFPWARNQQQRLELLAGACRAETLRDYVHERWKAAVEECDLLPEQQDREKKQMMQLNLYWFMQTLAERNDRMSARAGLQMRVPLCTPAIAQYLYAVPWTMKQDRGREKGLLRRAFQGQLPEAVLWRKKSPYPKISDPGFERLMERQLSDLLQQKNAPLFALVDRQALTAYFEGEAPRPWYGQLMRRPQTMAYFLQLDQWLRAWNVDIIS